MIRLIHVEQCHQIITMPNNFYSVDEYLSKMWVHFLAHKNQAVERFKEFEPLEKGHQVILLEPFAWIEGGEFTSQKLSNYLQEQRNQRQLTTISKPQQNGVANRRNHTILDLVQCTLKHAALSPAFWAEAIHTTVYLLN